jgi:hypothetical protein
VTTPETIRAQMVRTRAGLNRKLDALRSRLAGPVADSHEGKEDSMAENAKKKGDADKSSARSGGRSTTPKKAGASAASSAARETESKSKSKSKPKAKADTKSKPEAGARARSKASAKGDSSSGAGKTAKKRSRAEASTTSKTLEVVGEMLAGATVGAVSAVAANVDVSSAPTEPVASELAAMDTKKGKSKGAAKKAAKAKSPKQLLGEMAAPAAIGAVAGAVEAVLPKKGKKPAR